MNRSVALVVVLIAALGVVAAVVMHNSDAPQRSLEPAAISVPETSAITPLESLSDVEVAEESAPKNRDPATDGAVADSLVLEIIASDGTPVPNVRVVLTRAELVLESKTVESGGVVTLPPQGRDVDVFIFTNSALRLQRHLEDAIGSHVVRIPEGATLRGTVLVEGAAPNKSIPIQLLARAESSGFEPLPDFLSRQLGFGNSKGSVHIFVQSDKAGRFEFKDLPPTLKGAVSAPSWMYKKEDGKSIEITDVTQEVILRLLERPGITGRVVMRGTTSGIAKARGKYTLAVSEGNRQFDQQGTFETEEDGSFRIRFERFPSRVTATVSACGAGRASIDVSDFPATGMDVGDVVLDPAPDLWFVVHDPHGKPIERATASTVDDLRIVSAPTDSEGRGALCALPSTTERVTFQAPGYRSVTRNARSAVGASPLDVMMEPVAVLEIAVTERSGAPASRLPVRLKHAQDETAGVLDENGVLQSVQLLRGTPGRDDEEFARTYELDGAGRLRLGGLNPLTRFEISVEDLTRTRLFESILDASFIGSKEPYRIVLDTDASVLEVLVVDSARQPISGAMVSVDPRGEASRRTDAEGVARFEPIYTRLCKIRVDVPGQVTVKLDDVAITHELERREVVMTAGRSIEVRVVDRTGKSMRADNIGVKYEGKTVGRWSRCDDGTCFRVVDLPHGVLELTAWVAGQKFVQEHHSRDPVATIEIPAHGSLFLEFSEPLTPLRSFELELLPRGTDGAVTGAGRFSTRFKSESQTESLEVPLVFPGRYLLTLQEFEPPGAPSLYSRVPEVEVRAGERNVARVPIMH